MTSIFVVAQLRPKLKMSEKFTKEDTLFLAVRGDSIPSIDCERRLSSIGMRFNSTTVFVS